MVVVMVTRGGLSLMPFTDWATGTLHVGDSPLLKVIHETNLCLVKI